MGGIVGGILIDMWLPDPLVYHAEASIVTELVVEIPIRVEIDWTRERIIEEIRNTFPESPDVAVAIAQCESGLMADIQSNHTLHYGRELSWGIFQIHEPAHHKTAIRLGLGDYKTDPGDNIKLARYIYEQAGKKWTPWSCFTRKMI